MRDSMSMIRSKERGRFIGRMGECIRDSGVMVSSMGMEYLWRLMGSRRRESGIMVRGQDGLMNEIYVFYFSLFIYLKSLFL